jgi:hypothetical protein
MPPKDEEPLSFKGPVSCGTRPEDKMNSHYYHEKHVLPRKKQGKPYLEFDEKCDFQVFCKVAETLEKEWDGEMNFNEHLA